MNGVRCFVDSRESLEDGMLMDLKAFFDVRLKSAGWIVAPYLELVSVCATAILTLLIYILNSAEDWNLAKPLATCKLLVERRGDELVLEFYSLESPDTVFAASHIDLSKDSSRKIQYWLEQVVDSSRYFTLKITGQGGREAVIGFGFRDRDQATDLRESVQYYENACKREQVAASSEKLNYSIPKLAEGEKIHVKTSGTGRRKSEKKDGNEKKKGIPLLKKPPKSPQQSPEKERASLRVPAASNVDHISINLGSISLEDDRDSDHKKKSGDHDDGSDGAVFEGDEAEWATEFNG
jgi:hypothetical protein